MRPAGYLFIEARAFTQRFSEFFDADDAYADFQAELAAQPEKGTVIPGASPLRKLRWGDKRRGAGKRGGLRIIYLHIPDLAILFLVAAYSKDRADDLTTGEKKVLGQLAIEVIKELQERNSRGQL